MATTKGYIGFPEGMLRDKPLRLPVLVNESDWFCLAKCAGIVARAHPWYSARQDICRAIRIQAKEGKAELQRLKIPEAYYVCGPEPELAGPVVFAKSKLAAERLRNAFGSDQFQFAYRFVTSAKISEEELECKLPIAIHKREAKALISHSSGKKSHTRFRKLGDAAQFTLWEAASKQPRLHQIRLHAAELGIPVFGDNLYGSDFAGFPSPHGASKRKTTSRFPGMALVLYSIDLCQVCPDFLPLSAQIPKPFAALLRKNGLARAD